VFPFGRECDVPFAVVVVADEGEGAIVVMLAGRWTTVIWLL